MALPTTRATFKEACLRRLGKPVLDINLSEEQIEDTIDYCLSYYHDYHFDGSEKQYYKYEIRANNHADAVYSLTLVSGGTGYSNTDTVVFTAPKGSGAAATITTYANGTIQAVNLTNNGDDYAVAPTITITTSTGSGAQITATLGGFIELPENVIGAINIFDISSAMGNATTSMFSLTYQIALNDLWTFMSSSLVPYYMTMTHLRLLEEILVGKQPIRYNRHMNRLYIDTNWDRFIPGAFLIVEVYELIDPDVYPDVWKDRWLIRYTEAHLKKQWGTNMKKFTGIPLPGGLMFNGQQIYDEAIAEIDKLEQEMLESYSIPALDMYG